MKKTRLMSVLLSMVLLFTNTVVFTTPVMAAEESYALSITNKPGTTFVLEHDFTSDICDLWNEIDSEGSGELAFNQSFSININDAVDVYNNYLDNKYPNGEYDDHKASEDIHNGLIFYVNARILINDYDFQFSNKSGYKLAPYGLDGEKNEGCSEWYLSYSSYSKQLSEEFFTMSIDGDVLNLSLDGTVKEIYEALKAEDEALGDVTINNLTFELRVSCEVEYYNSWGDISYTELSFEAISHSLYDKHIYESASEYDNLSVIPITAPLIANVVPAYEGCYEPVETEYSWSYEFVKEGFDNEEDGIWYGYFERDETKESDVLTETAPSGTIFGVAYGKVDSGDKNYITLNDILNENNKDFINSFIGAKPRELGGNGQMFIGCTVTLTFADGKQYKVGITKADNMTKLIAPCMHACTVCGYCTVTDQALPCNFDQTSYEICNVCTCDEPSVPDFEVTVESESQMTIESTDKTVNVVVEKIEVEETSTHSFIVNTMGAVGADNVIALYNINVFDEAGYPYTLNQWYDEGEELTVSVPVSMEEALALQSGEAVLYHILADGTAEEVENVTVEIDGESATMIFTSDSFSPYIVARTATTYTVTVNGGTGGDYAEGASVTITANAPESGKQFKEWTTEDGVTFADATASTTTFTMPAKHVTVTATYEDIPVTTYALWVGGTQVTESNKCDILGDGKAKYDTDTKTLTLTGTTLTNVYNDALIYVEDMELIINAPSGLTLDNTANDGPTIYAYGSYDLTVNGNVDLKADTAPAIVCGKNLTINGNVKVSSANSAVLTAPGSVTINGNATINSGSSAPGISAGADIVLNGSTHEVNSSLLGSATVTITGDFKSTVTGNSPAINGKVVSITGKVDITSGNSLGIAASNKVSIKGDTKIEAKQMVISVNAGSVVLEGTKHELKSTEAPGIYCNGDITIKGAVIATAGPQAINSTGGTVTIDGDVTATSTAAPAITAKTIEVKSGTWKLSGNPMTMYAESIVIPNTHEIVKPVGAKLNDEKTCIVEADGTTRVSGATIAPKAGATKTPIDTVTISDLAKPVVGEMPDNDVTVSGTGVTVDADGSYWGRFVSPSFTPVYDDDTAVDSVVFRDGETYMFQLYLYAEDGYEFTEDSKFYFAGELLPAPDMTDLSKSFAMVNPADSSETVVYINMNDIAHVHVPGDWGVQRYSSLAQVYRFGMRCGNRCEQPSRLCGTQLCKWSLHLRCT